MNCHQCRQSCHAAAPPQHQRRRWRWWRRHQRPPIAPVGAGAAPRMALVGNPNVGKSALFNALTGTYVTVSNYPGTTVEITQGRLWLSDRPVTLIDTPGMYAMLPITEEERVARDLLLHTPFDLVVHVIDAKNLGRMLPLTFQLIEAQLPVLLVLNMIDEARQLRLQIDQAHLEAELGIPVCLTAAAQQVGLRELKSKMAAYVHADYLSAAR